ncbi:hypothetical protein D3C87_1194970 [compost metagenome]
MGVGAQEHLLAILLGLLQRAEQVRGRNPVRGQALVEVLVEVGVDARRFHFTEVFRVQAHLGRHHGHHQLHAFFLQGLAHAFDQRVVALQVQLFVDHRVELFIAVQPLVATEHHARTTFVEQFEIQRSPEVGAQALDRELVVVVRFHGFAPAAVEHRRIGVGAEAEEAAHRPQTEHQQGHQEQRDVEDA